MKLIADGGSTKADWIALKNNRQIFKTSTQGLNPTILDKKTLKKRILKNPELIRNKDEIKEIFFYGAGCRAPIAIEKFKVVLKNIFPNAKVNVNEDMLAAVYAATGGKEGIVAILGTGSNSCYYDGKKMHMLYPSLGYILMDEASGNWFGKQLIIDYYNKRMPENIAKDFEKKYDLSADTIKKNLYEKEAPNTYLAVFAEFMFEHKDDDYIKNLLRKGFDLFFQNRIIAFDKAKKIPIYFIGSIAWFFRDILEEIAFKYGLTIENIIRRPIDKLLEYHTQ